MERMGARAKASSHQESGGLRRRCRLIHPARQDYRTYHELRDPRFRLSATRLVPIATRARAEACGIERSDALARTSTVGPSVRTSAVGQRTRAGVKLVAARTKVNRAEPVETPSHRPMNAR